MTTNYTGPLLARAKSEPRLQTALHECAHAVAYIAIGRGFSHIDVDPVDSVGLLVPHYLPIDMTSKAQTSMVGPACEAMMFHSSTAPDARAVRFILDGLADAREFAEWEPDDPEASDDYTDAGEYAELMLPWSLATVTCNWSLIEDMARVVLTSDHHIVTFDELRSKAPGDPVMDPAAFEAWHQLVTA